MKISTIILIKIMFEGLQHSSAPIHLNISNTGLVPTEDTAQALTKMLQVKKTLTHLDLSHNEKFSDSGAYCEQYLTSYCAFFQGSSFTIPH